MKQKSIRILLFCTTGLILLFLVSCGPAGLVPTETATSMPTALGFPTSADCPPENWPCPSDSMTLTAVMAPTLEALYSSTQVNLTAAMGATLNAIPTNTPPAGAAVTPIPGDLGWGTIFGTITDGVTGLPIEGATVECQHFSYTSPYPCKGFVTTNHDGIYSFAEVYFHDTDRITLIVEAPGYNPLHFAQSGFTFHEFRADLGLFPISGESAPSAMPVMCTPLACSDGVLVCGSGDLCPLGCGAVCIPFTPTP